MGQLTSAPRTLLLIADDVGEPFNFGPSTTPMLWDLMQSATVHDLWTMPACSSTRFALWTRSYPCHNGIGTIIKASNPVFAHPELCLLPTYGRGSRAYYGKHHLCPPDMIEGHPAKCGWDHFSGHASNLTSGGQSGYWDWLWTTNSSTRRSNVYAPELMRQEVANALINSPHTFIAHGSALIHKPFHTPPDAPNVATDEAKALQMLARLDMDFSFLVSLALQTNSRVLLFSDNGAAGSLGGGKGTLHQSGIATKLYAWGFEAPPSKLDVVDIGTMIDAEPGPDAIGIGRREIHYAERFGPNNVLPPDPDVWDWAVEAGGWKLIHTPELGDQLFNLREDPGETRDLATDEPGHIDRLRYLARQIQAGAD